MATMEPNAESYESEPRATLMIVDDTPENLGFLFDYLEGLGFRVLVALDGEEALEKLEHIMPDLILLDVMMPGIDGFETCRRIKANPWTRDIPIIFMTALAEIENKLRGFDVGAVDYVTKPLSSKEVFARVSVQLSLRRLQRELEMRNQELGAFGYLVAHDLRASLNTVVSMSEILLEQVEHGESPSGGDIERILGAGIRMQEIIRAILLLSGFREVQVAREPIDTAAVVARVIDEHASAIAELGAHITRQSEWPTAFGYGPWVERVWSNYVGNALKYGGKPPQLHIGAEVSEDGERVRFWVRDNGPGVPEDQQEYIFTPFARLHGHRVEGHGLGLSMVRRIVARLGGVTGVIAAPGGGSEFYFELPSTPAAAREPELAGD